MEMTRCFTVVKDRDTKGEVIGFKALKGKVELNTILGAKRHQMVEVQIENRTIRCESQNIQLTRKGADRMIKERTIKHNFKKKKKGRWGWKCECCGTTYENDKDITVDHITPQSSFKDENGKTTDEKWAKCWDESNLAILCERCNKAKDTMEVTDFLDVNYTATKQYLKHSKCPRGDRHKFRTLFQADEDIEVARRDSRIIDVNVFFGRQPDLMGKLAMGN